MAEWEGKSKGTPLGYKIFIFIINKIGTSAAYLLLYPVVAWYFLFSISSNRALKKYFHKLQNFTTGNVKTSLFKSYYSLGQSLVDKIAILTSDKLEFDIIHEGVEHLNKMDKNKTGGFLISAHLGNWEIAGHLMKRFNTPVNVVLFDGEEEEIKEAMNESMSNRHFKTIPIKNDMSHMFKIHQAASNRELICIHGDRFLPGAKTLEEPFLGEAAHFPAGPFIMASKLNLPVSFVFGMKKNKMKYHFYCTAPLEGKQDPKSILKSYVSKLHEMVTEYPNQWFNFYPFWKKPD